jgi:hypothetical protein
VNIKTRLISLSTVTRLTGLLKEIREARDIIGFRAVNEYKDGRVQASGKYEYFCWHCSADKAPMPFEIKHELHCLLARIDAALEDCSEFQR